MSKGKEGNRRKNRDWDKRGRPHDDGDTKLPALVFEFNEDPTPYAEGKTRAKLWARWAWFSGNYSAKEIAEAIEVPDYQVYKWIRGTPNNIGWAKEKDKADKKAVEAVLKTQSRRLQGLMEDMLSSLELSAKELVENRHKLTISEFGQMTNALERIHKMKQLELGLPTENLGTSNASWSDLKKKMETVDILDLKEVEKIEVKK